MKYKTLKDHLKPLSIGATIVAILGIVVKYADTALHSERGGSGMPVAIILVIALAVALLNIYCFSGDFTRKKYIKEGTRLDGYIESAQESFNGRWENRYYLKISFYDEGKQIRYTEAYMGNPCYKLKSRKCSIYKLNGKYIEADFQVKSKKEKEGYINIPVVRKKM